MNGSEPFFFSLFIGLNRLMLPVGLCNFNLCLFVRRAEETIMEEQVKFTTINSFTPCSQFSKIVFVNK
jgi:hypothetical protein